MAGHSGKLWLSHHEELSVGVTGKMMFAEVGAKVSGYLMTTLKINLMKFLTKQKRLRPLVWILACHVSCAKFSIWYVPAKNLKITYFRWSRKFKLSSSVMGGFQVIVKHSKIADVTLDPQVTIGAAWVPTRAITLTVEADAMEIDSPVGSSSNSLFAVVLKLIWQSSWSYALVVIKILVRIRLIWSWIHYGVGFEFLAVALGLGWCG